MKKEALYLFKGCWLSFKEYKKAIKKAVIKKKLVIIAKVSF